MELNKEEKEAIKVTRTYEIQITTPTQKAVEDWCLEQGVSFGSLVDTITRMIDGGDESDVCYYKGNPPQYEGFWGDDMWLGDLQLSKGYGPIKWVGREHNVDYD